MTIVNRIRTAANALFKRDWSPWDDRWYTPFWPGFETHAGVDLNEATSLRIIAVYACVNLLASDVGTLPLPVYQQNRPRSRKKAEEHPLYRLLHDEPNSDLTSAVWRQTMMAHTLLWGNGYSEIEFDRSGRPRALWLLPTWRVKPKRTVEKRELYYELRLLDGGVVNIPPYAIFHIPALSLTGTAGLSPVRQAMEALGLAKAAEEMGARLFGKGANLGGIVQHPGTLSKEGAERLEESLNENYAGLGKAHRIMLLEEGMKWEKAGVNPEEAQFLQTRSFQRGEIASLFRVPPHMIGDTEKSTSWGTGIEQQNIGYVQHTLRPWLVLWEQEIKRKLFRGDGDHFAEFVVDGLLRGDIKSRYEAYQIARQNGWMNADDIRELENMNPLPDGQGQIYLVPLNMIPAQKAGEDIEPSNGNNRSLQAAEQRTVRGAILRKRTAESWEKVFADAAGRIAEREKQNVSRAVKKYLGNGDIDGWSAWLGDFYRDFPGYIRRQIEPPVEGLADAIYPQAANEINADEKITDEAGRFISDYTDGFDKRYTESSRNQLEAVVNEAKDAGGDTGEAVLGRLDEWERKRPEETALNETVRLSNAVAREVFLAGGFNIGWQRIDDCPVCRELHGQVRGPGQYFVGKDEILAAEGGNDIRVYRGIYHAPAHKGCTCQVTPVK